MVKSRSSSSSGSGSGSGSGNGKSCYRGHWRPAEDEKLRQLVEQFGPQNWNFIAEHFEGRSGKSCRLRWYNQLDPNINKNPFTDEEEERLLIYQQLHGNKWALIARHFKGRTDNAVKNHYHVIMARRRRERFTIFTHNNNNHQNNNITIRNKNPNHHHHSSGFSSSSTSNNNNNDNDNLLPAKFQNPKKLDFFRGFELLNEGRRRKNNEYQYNFTPIDGSSTSNFFNNDHKSINGGIGNYPFEDLNLGDHIHGNVMKMKMKMKKKNDNLAVFMKWPPPPPPVGSDDQKAEQAANNGLSMEDNNDHEKETLPFIDFLGMGSS